jgi:hypothetical protein
MGASSDSAWPSPRFVDARVRTSRSPAIESIRSGSYTRLDVASFDIEVLDELAGCAQRSIVVQYFLARVRL